LLDYLIIMFYIPTLCTSEECEIWNLKNVEGSDRCLS